MTTDESTPWAYQPLANMFNSSKLALKRGDVIYSDDRVRSSPWGAIKDWKGIQILEYSSVASLAILLKCQAGKLTSSKEIVISGPNLDSLIKTDKNWSGYEIISDQNPPFVVVKHQDIDGRTELGQHLHMSRADLAQLKKTGALNVYAQLGTS
jgi:hypothetical protein